MSNELRQAIHSMQSTLRASPTSAQARFNSASNLRDGFRSQVTIRQHQLTVDEPPTLGGTDAGPNPVELILAALGACQEITYKAYATALGIDLKSVAVTLTGEIDLRGFFGVDDSVRAGFHTIRGTVHIESSASAADLARLKHMVDSHCPVLDMLSKPVTIKLELAD